MKKAGALFAAASAMLMGGCASLASYGPTVGPNTPLDAHIYMDNLGATSNGMVYFDVNKPAHVAVFRIVPGRGTAMIYPRAGYGSMGQSVHGLQQVRTFNRGDYYAFDPTYVPGGPEFYLLIASEEPLELDRMGPYGNGLRNVLGGSFASGSAYATMEDLVETAVANPSGDGWVTDFYVHWPNTLYHESRPDLVQIQCGGYILYVPMQQVLQAYQALCPNAQENAGEQPSIPEAPSDTSGVVEPQRRKPVNPEERIASSQLEWPEMFDARRRAAVSGRESLLRDLYEADTPEARERFRDAVRTNDPAGRPGVGAIERGVERGIDRQGSTSGPRQSGAASGGRREPVGGTSSSSTGTSSGGSSGDSSGGGSGDPAPRVDRSNPL